MSTASGPGTRREQASRRGYPARGASVGPDSYDLADERYPLPGWAQYFVARVDHSPARWKRPATQGLTAAEALGLLEGLCASRLDRLRDWTGRQEAPSGSTGPAPGDDGQQVPHTGAGPVDGGPAVGDQDGSPPWLWPLLSLPS